VSGGYVPPVNTNEYVGGDYMVNVRVVLFEGKRNARVDAVLNEVFGSESPVYVSEYSQSGWHSSMAWAGYEGLFDSSTVSDVHSALMSANEDVLPELYSTEGYRKDLNIQVPDMSVTVVSWVIGGRMYELDEDEEYVLDEDVYEN
jgi:hypothetical protein